nr:immunoglobulin light chain junction region [Macaca mulatta]MPN88809.1 immunoglobulin light chain junction region [Macaca mulatta]
CQQCNTNPWTC